MAMHTPDKIFNMQFIRQARKNYSLIPILVVGSFGLGLAGFAMLRTLIRSPDITINKKSESMPYEKYLKPDGSFVQYKFLSPTIDYKSLKVDPERPKL